MYTRSIRSAASRCAASLAVSAVLLMLAASPATAETPGEVVEAADANGGVYIAPGMGEFDEAQLASIVTTTQLDGVRILVIAPGSPEPDAEAFALRVRQAADVEAVLLFDAEGQAWASVVADYDDGFVRALEGARSASTPEAATEVFVVQLVNEPDRPLPEVISTVVRWTILFVVALGLASLAEQLLRRRRRQQTADRQALNEAS